MFFHFFSVLFNGVGAIDTVWDGHFLFDLQVPESISVLNVGSADAANHPAVLLSRLVPSNTVIEHPSMLPLLVDVSYGPIQNFMPLFLVCSSVHILCSVGVKGLQGLCKWLYRNNNDSLSHVRDTHFCRSAIDLARQSLDAPVRTEMFSPRLMEVCCHIFCLP